MFTGVLISQSEMYGWAVTILDANNSMCCKIPVGHLCDTLIVVNYQNSQTSNMTFLIINKNTIIKFSKVWNYGNRKCLMNILWFVIITTITKTTLNFFYQIYSIKTQSFFVHLQTKPDSVMNFLNSRSVHGPMSGMENFVLQILHSAKKSTMLLCMCSD